MARGVAAFNFTAFLEKEELKTSGTNFMNWYHNLRIILTAAKKAYVLDAPLGEPPAPVATDEEANAYETRNEDHTMVQCGILYAMEPELQKHFEHHGVFEMIEELKMVFQTQARAERYETSEAFFNLKMEENRFVSEHIVKMFGYA